MNSSPANKSEGKKKRKVSAEQSSLSAEVHHPQKRRSKKEITTSKDAGIPSAEVPKPLASDEAKTSKAFLNLKTRMEANTRMGNSTWRKTTKSAIEKRNTGNRASYSKKVTGTLASSSPTSTRVPSRDLSKNMNNLMSDEDLQKASPSLAVKKIRSDVPSIRNLPDIETKSEKAMTRENSTQSALCAGGSTSTYAASSLSSQTVSSASVTERDLVKAEAEAEEPTSGPSPAGLVNPVAYQRVMAGIASKEIKIDRQGRLKGVRVFYISHDDQFGLTIEKNMTKIVENGGVLMPSLDLNATTHIILRYKDIKSLEKSTGMTEKDIPTRIKIVTWNWVKDILAASTEGDAEEARKFTFCYLALFVDRYDESDPRNKYASLIARCDALRSQE